MTCLAHDKHYRSLFHGVINELRKKQLIAVALLRAMPKMCCTCNDDENDQIIEPIINLRDQLELERFENFVQRVQTKNVKLTRSLNRLISIINDNTSVELSTSPSMETSESNSSFETDSQKEKRQLRLRKASFFFMSYRSLKTQSSENGDILIEIAKDLVRTRFLESTKAMQNSWKSTGQIMLLDSDSDPRLKDALEKTIKGLRNITIHNREEAIRLSQETHGEWVLFRPNPEAKKNYDVDAIADDLTQRWKRALQRKRDITSYVSSNRIQRFKRFRS